MILVALRAYGRTWPALLSWFLAGWVARLFLMRFAGWAVENVSEVAGQLVWTLAVLVRLASYVAMFLVVRPELPYFQRLDRVADRESPGPHPGFLATWVSTLSASILPFFVVYSTWGLIHDDYIAYTTSSLEQSSFDKASQGALEVPFTPFNIGLVVVAFALRYLLNRFGKRLPRWTALVGAYLEAVWVVIAVTLIGELLAGVPDWLASRRMFGWAVDGWASLRDQVPAIDFVSDAWAWIANQLGEVVAQPLAWLALAVVVLSGALPAVRRVRRAPKNARAAARRSRVDAARASAATRWERIGPRTRRVLMFPVNGLIERWKPIQSALRLIWAAGPVTLGIYVLLYGILTVGGSWLTWAAYRLIGPHDLEFWFALNQPLELLTLAILFPLQLSLIAGAFDRSLRALDERVTSPTAELAALDRSA